MDRADAGRGEWRIVLSALSGGPSVILTRKCPSSGPNRVPGAENAAATSGRCDSCARTSPPDARTDGADADPLGRDDRTSGGFAGAGGAFARTSRRVPRTGGAFRRPDGPCSNPESRRESGRAREGAAGRGREDESASGSLGGRGEASGRGTFADMAGG